MGSLEARVALVLAFGLASGPVAAVAAWTIRRLSDGNSEVPLILQATFAFALMIAASLVGGKALAYLLFAGARKDARALLSATTPAEVSEALASLETAELREPLIHINRTASSDRARWRERVAHLAALLHDLKARLAGLNLYVSAGPTDASAEGVLREELASLQSWLARALDVVRLEQADVLPRRMMVSMRALVEEAVRRSKAADGLGIDTIVEGDAQASVDPLEFGRALTNLVANARRAARTRVLVEIFPGLVRIRDDGPGLPGAFAELVAPFFRVEPGGASRTTTGTGLGLYVANRIVELHGGRLVCEHTDDRGTTILAYVGGSGRA